VTRRDFLVEIGTEELPPRSLMALAESFRDGVLQGLAAAGLAHGKAEAYATPRRLAVLVRRLAETQAQQKLERRGPPVSAAFDANGQPTRAALAFAESCGVAVAALTRVTEPKGEFLFCSVTRAGAPAATLLPGITQRALEGLPIARRMRWGAGDVEFVRPVHWLVMLHGDEVIECELLGLKAGRTTRGHRFHAPKPIVLRSPGGYVSALEKRGFVLVDAAARRERIAAAAAAAARAAGGEALIDPTVLDEVTALCEWPVPIAGTFEARFLELPPEVLIATLQDHQRYFPARSASGALLPLFIAVANIESRDPAQVRAGNERVVRPRLADAAFFYAADRKQTLASRREALGAVTFQARLGSLSDKTVRITALAAQIASLAGNEPAAAQRAAELAKCDLLTAMVGEFPELQGVMGRYYATHDGDVHRFHADILAPPLWHPCAQVRLYLLRQLLEEGAGRAAATRAGDDHRRERAQAHRLQDFLRDDDLAGAVPFRLGSERDADRVADALLQQNGHRRGRRDDALAAHAGLGEPEVQRIVAAPRELAVHGDQVLHGGDLARQHDAVAGQAQAFCALRAADR